MTELITKLVLSYLLGSLIGSLIVGRFRGGVDIRTLGSGNAGGTNALRTQGKGFAFWVMLIDIGKGWIAAGLLAVMPWPWGGAAGPELQQWLPVACASAAIIGHVFPLWYGFRGGKGAATLIGALLGLHPWLLVPVLAMWLAIVTLSGYVSLASMGAALTLPAYVAASGIEPRQPLLVFGVIIAALVIFTHRGNIVRIRTGSEPRATRLWLLGGRKA